MAIIFIGNPYNHSEEKRESFGKGSCAWCGMPRKRLFAYNGGVKVCNKACNEAYYG